MDRLHNGVKDFVGLQKTCLRAPQGGKKFDNVTQAIGINAKSESVTRNTPWLESIW
jgi:hypothetical protein